MTDTRASQVALMCAALIQKNGKDGSDTPFNRDGLAARKLLSQLVVDQVATEAVVREHAAMICERMIGSAHIVSGKSDGADGIEAVIPILRAVADMIRQGARMEPLQAAARLVLASGQFPQDMIMAGWEIGKLKRQISDPRATALQETMALPRFRAVGSVMRRSDSGKWVHVAAIEALMKNGMMANIEAAE